MENVNEMAVQFYKLVNDSLDEIAPIKTVTIKPGYKTDLTLETKSLMNERDKARREIKTCTVDKRIALQKNRTLRNRVTCTMRNETRKENGRRIDNQKMESGCQVNCCQRKLLQECCQVVEFGAPCHQNCKKFKSGKKRS